MVSPLSWKTDTFSQGCLNTFCCLNLESAGHGVENNSIGALGTPPIMVKRYTKLKQVFPYSVQDVEDIIIDHGDAWWHFRNYYCW